MRRKVSTLLEENLYRRVKVESARQGKQISALIGEALELYLKQNNISERGLNVVSESWAILKMPESRVKRIVLEEGDFLDA